MASTVENTVKNNLCINCGLCKTVCKFDAIKMVRNEYGEVNPVIDIEKCKNCGQCLKYCPQEKEKLFSIAQDLSKMEFPHRHGLEDSKYYVAWDNNDEQRLKCCSGGAVTKFASYLMVQGKIDGMIHTQRLWGKRGDLHYGAKLSETIEEINENVSSTYQAIDFSDVLSKLEKGKTYFMTGTPCVIRGIKNLLNSNKDFSEIKIITCALICSHNVNSAFADFLTEVNKLSDKDLWQINMRAKDETIPDANNFKNYIYTKEETLMNKNRFESGWTSFWRFYYFAMNSCLYCPDFWGAEADISVKDAWGKWADEDAKGKSILVIRNEEVLNEFLNCGLEYEELDYETMKDHQRPTPVYKQTDAIYKFTQKLYSNKNRKSKFLRYYVNSRCSKFLYKHFGFRLTYHIMKIINAVTWLLEKI